MKRFDSFADLFVDESRGPKAIDIFRLTACAILVAAALCAGAASIYQSSAWIDTWVVEAAQVETSLRTVTRAELIAMPTPKKHKGVKPGVWKDYKITAYGNQCAIWDPEEKKIKPSRTGLTKSGTPGEQGRTVAADPKVLPTGSKVHIAGVGVYDVTDTGPKGYHIDLFLDDCDEAIQVGSANVMRARRLP